MREVQVVAWCDKCREADKRVPATRTVSVSLGGETAKALDLCPQHEAKLISPLAALLSQFGVDEKRRKKQMETEANDAELPEAPATAVGEFDCLFCGRNFNQKTGLLTHLVRIHAAPPAPVSKCPECKKTFDAPSRLGMHRKAAHGYDSLAAAIEWVEKHQPTAA